MIKREAERQFLRKKKKVSTSGFKLRKLTVGSLVRVSLMEEKRAVGHKGSKPNWSKTIYRVRRILKSKRGKDRFVLHHEHTDKRHGIFFRDKLLAVSQPKRSKDQKQKYKDDQPWGPEFEEKEDKDAPKPVWAGARKAAGAQDDRESSGEEYEPEEKASPPPPPPAAKKKPPPKKNVGGRRVRAADPKKMIGRTVKMEGDQGIVVEIYRERYFIIVFDDEKTTFAALRSEIRVDYVRPRALASTLSRLKKKCATEIRNSKREVDEEETS